VSQTEPQAATQRRQHHNAGRLWGTPFARGVNGKAARLEERRRRIELKARELAGEIGGFDNAPPFKRALLLQAGELLIERRPVDSVRTANALRRIYSVLGLAVSKPDRRTLQLAPQRKA
jgi:hypothetical protein